MSGGTGPSGVKRRRGGQPGNTNALKHGFYAKNFSPGESSDLDGFVGEMARDLKSEIFMLRVIIRRTMELADAVENLDEAMGLLSTLSSASIRLASLLKTQKLLGSGAGDENVAQAISQALSDVVKDMGIER